MSLSSIAAFESDEHRRMFARQLAARRTASKFMYAGSGVALHEQLARDHPEEYEHGRTAQEMAALIQAAGGNLSRQICDVGTSNGVHTEQLLRLYQGAQPDVRLLGLDFSARMLEIARVRLASSNVSPELAVWDAERGATDVISGWRFDSRVLICLLGNTLGNVEVPSRLLQNLARSAKTNDLLLVSVYLQTDEDDTTALQYYRWGPIHDLIVEPLRSAGLAEHEMRLHLAWRSKAVVGEVELLAPQRLLGVPFDEGERIRCFLSRRYDVSSVVGLLDSSGWRTLHHDVAGGRGVFVAERR